MLLDYVAPRLIFRAPRIITVSLPLSVHPMPPASLIVMTSSSRPFDSSPLNPVPSLSSLSSCHFSAYTILREIDVDIFVIRIVLDVLLIHGRLLVNPNRPSLVSLSTFLLAPHIRCRLMWTCDLMINRRLASTSPKKGVVYVQYVLGR